MCLGDGLHEYMRPLRCAKHIKLPMGNYLKSFNVHFPREASYAGERMLELIKTSFIHQISSCEVPLLILFIYWVFGFFVVHWFYFDVHRDMYMRLLSSIYFPRMLRRGYCFKVYIRSSIILRPYAMWIHRCLLLIHLVTMQWEQPFVRSLRRIFLLILLAILRIA